MISGVGEATVRSNTVLDVPIVWKDLVRREGPAHWVLWHHARRLKHFDLMSDALPQPLDGQPLAPCDPGLLTSALS